MNLNYMAEVKSFNPQPDVIVTMVRFAKGKDIV